MYEYCMWFVYMWSKFDDILYFGNKIRVSWFNQKKAIAFTQQWFKKKPYLIVWITERILNFSKQTI